jgi:hypothetical protein
MALMAPLRLPLQLRLLSRLPLVVGAFVDKRSGHLTDVCARVYVEGMPLKEAPAAEAAAAAVEVSAAVADAV